ncbi:hypothetical protein F2Q69_00016993 [Brassica cretica]|uniref:Uncharacterized protein n=1 Tax=Brassica cretica TaxID=69181 RepID=A0A8S9QRQ4_BRACR|nr:hypothetical protein F2Q69_00016993 [Brassica cretica]
MNDFGRHWCWIRALATPSLFTRACIVISMASVMQPYDQQTLKEYCTEKANLDSGCYNLPCRLLGLALMNCYRLVGFTIQHVVKLCNGQWLHIEPEDNGTEPNKK